MLSRVIACAMLASLLLLLLADDRWIDPDEALNYPLPLRIPDRIIARLIR